MNALDRAVGWFFPSAGLRRARARAATSVLMNYGAATSGNRASSWRASAADADAAAAKRARLAFVTRDMIRNTPFATRAQAVITGNVVGTGIIPKVSGGPKGQQDDLRDLIQRHLDTTSIDADGLNNLYGLQRLAMNAIFDGGEVLIRRRLRERRDGLPLALQLQVLEGDFLDSGKDGVIASGGGEIREGIEYDAIGRRTAYWLFPRHPGGVWRRGSALVSRRVPASEVLHVFRPDRPGQMRGVSWLAPVALRLQDEDDHQDAQLMRQKIAACFAGFRVEPDGEGEGGDAIGETLVPGRIQKLKPGEDIRFTAPPAAEGYDEFTRAVLRSAAAGVGITYEALTGDLSRVNFTSYKAGRIEMDRNIEVWQWLMLIPMMMQPIGRWIMEAWALERMARPSAKLKIEWVPPVRPMIDPAREIGAARDKVRAGFASRQGEIRAMGYDPEKVLEEQKADAKAADLAGLTFDSDARVAASGAPAPRQAGGQNEDGGTGQDDTGQSGAGTGNKETDDGEE